MKKTVKKSRFLAMLLCLVLCISAFSTTAFAAGGTPVDLAYDVNPIVGGKTTNLMTEGEAGSLTYTSSLDMSAAWQNYSNLRSMYLLAGGTEADFFAKTMTAEYQLNVQLDTSRVSPTAEGVLDNTTAIKNALVGANPNCADFINLFDVTAASYNSETGLWQATLKIDNVSVGTLDPILTGENVPGTVNFAMPVGCLSVHNFEGGKNFDADCHITGSLIVESFSNPMVTAMLPITFDEQDTATVQMVEQVVMDFNKYLVMKGTANVPNATFGFSIEPGTAVAGTDTTPAIMAGPAGAVITNGTVSFSGEDVTYNSVQTGDTLTLASGEKYAKKAVNVDMTGVDFTEPGVYRYVITESGTNTGVTNDANTSRYLDVVITINDDGAREFTYILHPTDVVMNDNAEFSQKDDGFVNRYTSYDLSLTKQITGNQGVREKYFKFTVSIANAVPGSELTVNYLNGAVSGDVAVDGTTYTNPTRLTVAADGSVTQDFYLNDDDTISIGNLSADATYTISEENGDYKASYTVDAGTTPTEGNSIAATSMDSKDHAVEFTNNRTGIVPTGILLEVAPYLTVFAIALAGAVLLLVKKRRNASRS